ncbi:YXWGXW repeat-containing protein [Ancylobacter pratisalsi]|uniref:BcpO-related WXXGXW repeat protein n=1 Tax=Ancylobacter pratisalsi TaxID=1745854 RepID=A0A6P1YPJ1_9HYPH|nr:YXWGXW repeat-containing protein [Ancylobacter pratisalsi]QIB35348.1 BcpO-related WXXGXW repeat protein [Ancylobacter pratisalsi]
MLTRRSLLSLLATAVAAVPLGLAATDEVEAQVVMMAPPPLRREPRPAARRGWVWVPGYWTWSRGRWVWEPGRWVRARPGFRYAGPSWVRRRGGWVYVPGRWVRI